MSRSTFSKSPSRYPAGYPQAIVDGYGSKVTGSDGRQYVDWVQGLGGAGIFGHGVLSVQRETAGMAFHLPHALEDQVAGLLRDMLPWAEETRFCLNGTDATAGAVRLARAVTGRDTVIVFEGSYHGESTGDWSLAARDGARGLTSHVLKPLTLQWNKPEELHAALAKTECAAVIFEVGSEDPNKEFVEALNSAWKYGALLIADEVVTGFRLGLQGACGRFEIKPNLACYGKALGSGVPIAALCGRDDLMDEFDPAVTHSPVFMSFTHAGNTTGLSAAKYTLQKLLIDASDEPYGIYHELAKIGFILMNALARNLPGLHPHVCELVGQPERSALRFHDTGSLTAEALRAIFVQTAANFGVLFGIPNFPTLAHTSSDLKLTEQAIEYAMAKIRLAIERDTLDGFLEGPVPRPLYQVRT